MGKVRVILLGLLVGLMAAALGGCGLFKPVESLFAPPALPEEYSQLQTEIQTVMNDLGAEYAAISYGSNTAAVQLLDMDGDGNQEIAAVFLRVLSAEEKPLRVGLFRRSAEGTYRLEGVIAGDGLSIYSVVYEDLTGDGVREMIISWQMGVKVQNLSVYQISREGTDELMNIGYNERFLTADLDGEGGKELVVIQHGASETEQNRAEYYRYQDSMMVMASSAKLSACITDVTGAVFANLSDGGKGIYVTGNADDGAITDILTLKNNRLVNVTLDKRTGMSPTLRSYTEVGATDINRDGVIELPVPTAAPNIDQSDETPRHYFILWEQFDSQGASTLVSDEATYHSVTDGWYFIMPHSWTGKVTVERDDSRSIRGERAVVFYYWPDKETTTPAPFLTIYRLTGENRFSRSKLTGRFTLRQNSSAIYCATLNTDVWDCGLEESQLAPRFNLITPEWSTQ